MSSQDAEVLVLSQNEHLNRKAMSDTHSTTTLPFEIDITMNVFLIPPIDKFNNKN